MRLLWLWVGVAGAKRDTTGTFLADAAAVGARILTGTVLQRSACRRALMVSNAHPSLFVLLRCMLQMPTVLVFMFEGVQVPSRNASYANQHLIPLEQQAGVSRLVELWWKLCRRTLAMSPGRSMCKQITWYCTASLFAKLFCQASPSRSQDSKMT